MAPAMSEPADSVIPDPRTLRVAQLLRAGILVAIGLAIAFSATSHESIEFDRWMLITALLLIGLATAVEYFVLRASKTAWLIALRAVLAFTGASVLISLGNDAVALAIIVAFWAAATAVVSVIRLAIDPSLRRQAGPSALLSGGLAVVMLLVREDPVAVIGFFGAYAVIRGVFLGIAALDTRPGGEPERADAVGDGDTGRAAAPVSPDTESAS